MADRTPKGYTTKEEVANYVLQDIDASFEQQIDNWIAAVESIIDKETGRNFVADTVATARLFDGDNTQELLIDEAVEISTVEVGNDDYGSSFTTITSSGADRYFEEPMNHAAKDLPVYKLVLRSRIWPEGKQNNRITAKWGYSAEAPADIQFIATVFVAGIVNQHAQKGEHIKSEKIGNYTVTYNAENGNDSWADFLKAKELLASYRVLYL